MVIIQMAALNQNEWINLDWLFNLLLNTMHISILDDNYGMIISVQPNNSIFYRFVLLINKRNRPAGTDRKPGLKRWHGKWRGKRKDEAKHEERGGGEKK